jgi:hypothetical protein
MQIKANRTVVKLAPNHQAILGIGVWRWTPLILNLAIRYMWWVTICLGRQRPIRVLEISEPSEMARGFQSEGNQFSDRPEQLLWLTLQFTYTISIKYGGIQSRSICNRIQNCSPLPEMNPIFQPKMRPKKLTGSFFCVGIYMLLILFNDVFSTAYVI